MLLSLNWLRDYLQKADVKIDARDLAQRLTMRGLQVAQIKQGSTGLDNVVVARIEKIEKHPNADRLQVTQVVIEDSPNAALKQIVCGAKNIAVGDLVPVALPGAVLPGDLKIKVSAIRGVESNGMICSGKELGISDESEGILQLPKHAVLGEPVSRLLGHSNDDTVIEFELTPDRPDCLSLLGLAREICPLLKTKLRDPKPARFRVSPHRTSSIIKVEVEDETICPRYVARVIDGIKVTESPDWIKARLQTVGIRPINNIVDITNFVMLEYGQPLHAFDLRKIESSTVKIARCKAQTDFTLLSGETVQLKEGDILIQDGERPIALAGIMGGANSHIQDDTTSIVLESASFLPTQIRSTAKRLNLSTDASKRFEKGVDPIGVALASERAAALLRDSFNANVYHPPIDTNETGFREHTLSVDMREVRKLTGIDLSAEEVGDVLEEMGLAVHRKSMNVLNLRIPSYRLDLKEGVDVIEEVARLIGYDAVPERQPISDAAYQKFDESAFDFEQRARGFLQAAGLMETIHYSFTSEAILNKFGVATNDAVVIQNPLSEEMKVMRTSLMPSLLGTYLYNRNRKTKNQRLFEVARTYAKDDQEETKVKETTYVAGLLSGAMNQAHWKPELAPVDFYFGKGLVEMLTRELSTVLISYEPLKHHKLFHPARSAVLKLGVREVGYVGEVHPFLRDNVIETTEPVVLFELNLDAIRKYERTTTRYRTPSKFPSIEVDLAFTLDRGVTSHSLLDAIKHTGGSLLQSVNVFDVYQGENIPQGKKSLAVRLNFFSPERTLLDEEVNTLKDKIIQTVSEKHGGQLRQ